MIYRVAASHSALLVITASILFGCVGIMSEQVKFLTENMHLDFIPEEVRMEDNFAILVAAFGVFLEHRGYLFKRIYPDQIPEPVQEFDDYSHNMGVMFILVAVLLVALDLLFLTLDNWGLMFAGLKYIEISMLFTINLMAFAMLISFGIRSFRSS